MNTTANQLFKACAQDAALESIHGKASLKIKSISAFQDCKKGDLVFVPDVQILASVVEKGATAVVIPKSIFPNAESHQDKIAILVSKNLKLSHAIIKQTYGDHNYSKNGWEKIHPSAVIHESVKLPKDIIIGPNVVIEKGVKIGKGSQLMANVVVEHNASIGDNVRIHPAVTIGWECQIGNDCIIGSNTVIGGEGFGFAQDQSFNHHRIPQTGNVIIGNKVTIGANSTFDRGTYGPTTIGDGCIFDNLCHVAHNVTFGENCIAVSGFLCAGSSIIGNRVVCSGGTMIKDHVKICDDVYLMHRAGVVKNITEPGMYAGGPALPMKEYVKNNAIYSRLGELRQKVIELEKMLKEKS